MAAMLVHTARSESQTYDEGMHLVSGYTYWKTGRFDLNREHPPLSKLIAAAPLLLLDLDLPAEGTTLDRGWKFVYENRSSHETILLTARCAMAAVTIAFGFALAHWTRVRYSNEAALMVLAFYTTDPNWIAHGKYITSDVLVAGGFFAAAMSWDQALQSGLAWRQTALAAGLLGVALAAKFSALCLIPLHAILTAWHAWRGVRFDPLRIIVVFAGAGLAVALVYGPESFRRHPPLAEEVQGSSPATAAIRQVAADYRLPAHPYLFGVADLAKHVEVSHPAYLNGRTSKQGDWRYFPTAFAVKTPLALLLGLAGAVLFLHRFEPWLIYPAAYFALSVHGNLNIGIRHLLPVYPFLFVLVAVTFAHHLRRAIPPVFALFTALALLIHGYEFQRTHPDHTAFFNSIAGGPEGGHRYLLDSNLDWGQDAKRLGEFMRRNRLPAVCLSYFGTARLHLHGVIGHPIPDVRPMDFDCVTAVSLNAVYGIYLPPTRHPWIRELQPDFTIGRSIRIYDLRRDKTVQLLR